MKKQIAELKKVRAGFQALVLPEGLPPTSSDIIARLNEHLLNVVSQLHRKEAELGRAQEALEKYHGKFSVIIHQQVRELHVLNRTPCIYNVLSYA